MKIESSQISRGELAEALEALQTIQHDISENEEVANVLLEFPIAIRNRDDASNEEREQARKDILAVDTSLKETHRQMLEPRFRYVVKSLWGLGFGEAEKTVLKETIEEAYPEVDGNPDSLAYQRVFMSLVISSALSGNRPADLMGKFVDTRLFTSYNFFKGNKLPLITKPSDAETQKPVKIFKGKRDPNDPSKVWVNMTDPRVAETHRSAEVITGVRTLVIAGCSWNEKNELTDILWARETSSESSRTIDARNIIRETVTVEGVDFIVERVYRSMANGTLVPKEFVIDSATIKDHQTQETYVKYTLAAPSEVQALAVGPASPYVVRGDKVLTVIPAHRTSIEEGLADQEVMVAMNELGVDHERQVAESAAGTPGSIFDTFRPLRRSDGSTIRLAEWPVGKTN